MKKRVIFMGTPEFAAPSLEALINNAYEMVAVYTQPDKEAGRGRHITLSLVKELALSRGLEVVQPEALKDSSVVAHIASLKPDLIVVAAYGRIIPPEVLSMPEFGCINVHPSLLPCYRGSSPIATAILQGDEVSGVTIMLLDKGMDTGPILAQKSVSISGEDTTGSLTVRLAQFGAQLLVETLPQWFEGKITPQPQDENRASYTKIISKEDGELDWHLTALELWRRVRAFDPWPGCYTWWKGKRLKVNETIPLAGGEPEEAGKVVALPQGAEAPVGVGTRDGILGLIRIQLEGKRIISAEEFVRGQRDFVGSSLL
jgi:methionyl-tRNA formyltransferase